MTRLVAVFTRWWILIPTSGLIIIAAVKGILMIPKCRCGHYHIERCPACICEMWESVDSDELIPQVVS